MPRFLFRNCESKNIQSGSIVNMLLIKQHNGMMMELLSPCYVNQEARQAPKCKIFGKGKMHNLFQ